MRGGFLHNWIIEYLAALLETSAIDIRTEVAIRPGRDSPFIDLTAELPGGRLAIEVEMSPSRALRDVDKARMVGARWLWIITPTARAANRVRRRLRGRERSPQDPRISVLTLSRARTSLEAFAGGLNSDRTSARNQMTNPLEGVATR